MTKGAKTFCFEAQSWKKVVTKTILLNQVFRQADSAFASLLNEVRLGRVTEQTRRILEDCMKTRNEEDHDGIEPTRLFSLLTEVDAENSKRLDNLSGEAVRVVLPFLQTCIHHFVFI